ncbi:MAG: hypothetical protein ACJAXK_000430 [Yoonia sp.]|jgi:hypothetical protein
MKAMKPLDLIKKTSAAISNGALVMFPIRSQFG